MNGPIPLYHVLIDCVSVNKNGKGPVPVHNGKEGQNADTRTENMNPVIIIHFIYS